jgi:indolepyruvate ferredoxin oxidoreductase
VQRAINPGQVVAFVPRQIQSLDALVHKRVEFLTAYQNAAYAQSYADFVGKVRAAEASAVGGDKHPLTEAVARYLFKLMAYKDEYEVARLHTDAAFRVKVESMFEGDFKLAYHLAPPLLARKNEMGELQKSRFGSWVRIVFGLLAPLKVLRGTALDVFGYTQERREERALVGEYRQAIESFLPTLCADNRDAAATFARLPEQIRGFGHVKARHLHAVRQQWAVSLAQYQQAATVKHTQAA